jgi:hypothetical protein
MPSFTGAQLRNRVSQLSAAFYNSSHTSLAATIATASVTREDSAAALSMHFPLFQIEPQYTTQNLRQKDKTMKLRIFTSSGPLDKARKQLMKTYKPVLRVLAVVLAFVTVRCCVRKMKQPGKPFIPRMIGQTSDFHRLSSLSFS